MKMLSIKKKMAILLAISAFCVPQISMASGSADYEAQIAQQQKVLAELNQKKAKAETESILSKMADIESQIFNLKGKKNYDAEAAVSSLSDQLNELRQQLATQIDAQTQILKEIKEMKSQQISPANTDDGVDYDNSGYHSVGNTSKFLVNPGPMQEEVGYTQDALNAQGNSTMVFKYAPNQLYKIYCRQGYLTDLAFKKGEKITFAGGGDTIGWSVSSTDADGVPYLFIKPVVATSTTNLIVVTTHHTYQIILNTSDWYNPMVVWTYGAEDRQNNLIAQQKEDKIVTGSVGVSSAENLNFDYEMKGSEDNRPAMIFDDGSKTYIKFKKLSNRLPVLFTREKGKRSLSIVNYKVKDNFYIIDKTFDYAELRFSDNEIIKIQSK